MDYYSSLPEGLLLCKNVHFDTIVLLNIDDLCQNKRDLHTKPTTIHPTNPGAKPSSVPMLVAPAIRLSRHDYRITELPVPATR